MITITSQSSFARLYGHILSKYEQLFSSEENNTILEMETNALVYLPQALSLLRQVPEYFT